MRKNLIIAVAVFCTSILPTKEGVYAAIYNFIDTPSVNIIVPIASANAKFPSFIDEIDAEKSMAYVENFCAARKNYIISSYKRSRKLYPKAVSILNKYNVPAAFKILLTIESDCNPNVVSHAGAVGYWQFIDAAATDYGLKIVHQLTKADKEKLKKENPLQADSIIKAVAKQKDDRKNFNKSTHAAARYLKDRMKNLGGDMLLVAASYNCGIGNVRNAMYKTGETNPTFWDVKPYLPKETQNYVMNFIALNVAFDNYHLVANNTISFKAKKETPTEEPVSKETTTVVETNK